MDERFPHSPFRERDNCGIGFVADLRGRRRHRTLAMALEALGNLEHRGAVSADGRTGDGVGVLAQLPRELFRRHLEDRGLPPVPADELAVGTFFFPPEADGGHRRCRELVEGTFRRGELELLAWRRVPTRPEVLGEVARASCPEVLQALVRRPANLGPDAFERRLYLTRRRIERRAHTAGLDSFYVVSLSHRTVIYKALTLASELGAFYPDLRDPYFETALAIFHQRFSTNTLPAWRLAQPFRFLAHNGEINTIQGNANWMAARERELRSALFGEEVEELLPVIQEGGSDSGMLDNVLELLVMFGRSPLHAMMMLIPEADRVDRSPELQAFYDYHATLMEPWDGPAAVVFSDGRLAAAALDRNGLRPQRYWVTDDDLVILGSETGVVELPPERVVRRGRLGPGQMLAVDVEGRRLYTDAEIKRHYSRRKPYGEWLRRYLIEPPAFRFAAPEEEDDERLLRRQRAFGYSREMFERILDPMMMDGKQPVGSMGDDTPIPALSRQPQLLYGYFKQRFSQVTNPAIDSLRERSVFSLETMVGPWGCVLNERPESAHLARFRSPIIRREELAWLLALDDPQFRSRTFDALFPAAEGAAGLERSVGELCQAVEAAVDDGCSLIVLSDAGVDGERSPIPMLLATGAVHHHLIRERKRMQVSIICDTGEPREDHHFACLIGFGATLIHPHLMFESIARRARRHDLDPEVGVERYLAALEAGLLKIMAKLGVCPSAGYQGAQLFEALGLDAELVDRCFTGTPSRVGGVGYRRIARDVLAFHDEAYGGDAEPSKQSSKRPGSRADLADRGLFRFRKGGEHHALNPMVFKALHKAVRKSDPEAFRRYAELSDEGPPSNLRDLLTWRRPSEPLPLEKVEPAEAIVRRFITAAMSFGAVSRETHEALAVAMNRIGGRSNSGEGGEEPERFLPYAEERLPSFVSRWRPEPGDWGNSAVKQVASGRFGVTPHYLVSARELEIKMAQGSKPGEGGQIPGHKVSPEIARLRGSVPGVSLISPPPHHDIYSIEDLAQLIYDLKRVSPKAQVGVKLVSVAGVGTIAAGVAKAYADYVQISGDSGGTGASPLSSIKHAGMPWELGLAEAQRVLVENGLRGRVRLRVDGGLKTGRDVVIAALLGAEEFGFGTVPLISLGCIMARQCHLDTCPVGIATQREDLRRKFPGQPEHVVAFMTFVAEQVRLILAEMGCRSLDEAVGRTDLLALREIPEKSAAQRLDLSHFLRDPDPTGRRPRRCQVAENRRPQRRFPLDQRIWDDCRRAVEAGERVWVDYPITNRDRTVGGRLSGAVAERTGGRGLEPGTVTLDFRGTAGQSFGAFLIRGVRLRLVGDAQDYVGKGLAGGEVVIHPPRRSRRMSHEQVVAGNTLLYGATGGTLFVAGQVGERFCVRNSGARAVVEGCGDHGCEYMTGGVAVILGATGENFGAGMSGGTAFVHDPEDRLAARIHEGSVRFAPASTDDLRELHRLLLLHAQLTGSERASAILDRWEVESERFRKVAPAFAPLSGETADTATAAGREVRPDPSVDDRDRLS